MRTIVEVKNFTLSEMTKSLTAEKRRLDNTPNEKQVVSLVQMMESLQDLRNEATVPVRVTSGFRSDAVNDAVGGAYGSKHTTGEAADIQIPKINDSVLICDLIRHVMQEGVFTKILLESKDKRIWWHCEFSHQEYDGNPEIGVIIDGILVEYDFFWWVGATELKKWVTAWLNTGSWE